MHPQGEPGDEGLRIMEERQSNLRSARILLLGLPVALLLWWPTAALLFRNSPEARAAVARARLELTSISLLWLLLLTIVPVCRRYPRITAMVGVLLLAICYGQEAAAGGDATAPWWPVFHLAPLCTAAFLGSLSRRVAATFGITAAAVGAFLLASPDSRADPASAYLLSTLVFACLVSITTGHLGHRLWHRAFSLRQQLKNNAARLEERVREQTAELRQLVDGIQTAREAERQHIARELHDDLGQQLTGLDYALTLLDQRFAKKPDSVTPNLRDLRRQLDRTTETMRRILLDLRPPLLDELGLAMAARSLLDQLEERGLQTSFDASGAFETLPHDLSAALFRLLQEALNNVARHAEARRVEVVLRADDASVELRVTDDGVGLSEPVPAGRLGLIGMRERTQAFGGQLDLQRGPAGGTLVSVRIPLVASPSRQSA